LIDFTPDRIKEVCGAALVAGGPSRASSDDMARHAVVDSRKVGHGDLFVGIRGEHVDGGSFAEGAIAAGAWGVIVTMEHAMRAVAEGAGRARVFAVDDPLDALGRLGRAWTDRLWAEGCKVVGITGSTGKTTTKDILFSLLEPSLRRAVHASRANYNTEIGVPLAVLEADVGTRVMVIEMAMRGPGQIRELCAIAPPDTGIITNVGPVHLELLGTVEAIAEAKAELIAALPNGCTCVVPAAAEALRPHLRSDVRTLTFEEWPPPTKGELAETERVASAAADIRVLHAQPAEVSGVDGMRVQIAVASKRSLFEFNFRQAHNITNALAAIGAGHALGFSLEELSAGAREVRFSSLRGEQVELGGVVIINDCYNANPISMRAALDHLAAFAAERNATRRVAVLGEMRELGAEAGEFHRRVGEQAAQVGVDLLIAVGPLAESYLEGFGRGEPRYAGDAEEAAAILGDVAAEGDVVLVKGSRSVGLEQVTEALARSHAEGVR
jgi:UDP-N-acetylmuramoyl-tripeptide--D-alanyl-D-alanine ligase